MMSSTEISALFTLIDDPDEEVFVAVSERIKGYGSAILPELENLWETTPNTDIQNRIEFLIQRLYYQDLFNDFREWSESAHHDLLLGALLSCKYKNYEFASATVIHEIEKIRKNIWLELNNYLTPLEQVNVFSKILYSYFGLQGAETSYANADGFLLNEVLTAKKGNQICNGILYLLLAGQLDIPVRAIAIPKQFVLAYFKPVNNVFGNYKTSARDQIEFFVDPFAGHLFTHADVDSYFQRQLAEPDPAFFLPQSNKQVIRLLLQEYSRCFTSGKLAYKQDELQALATLLA